jgi:xanthine dehydrogenase molybdenum-binding subunit
VVVAAVDKGQGALSTFAAIAGEVLGLRPADVHVVGENTDEMPMDYMGAEASRSTFVMGRAVADAAERLRAEMREAVASQLEVDPESVHLRNGAVVVGDGAGSVHSFADVAKMVGGPLVVHGEFHPRDNDPLPVVGAHFCEVRVDTYTGAVAVLRYVAAQDVGRVINRLGCEGQIEGGLHHGIGYALTEQLTYDAEGQPENPTFLGYKVMMAPDMPSIVPLLIEKPDDQGGPFGAKGIGTPVIPAIAPAVVNAIHDAVGVRMYQLPVTPYRLLEGMGVRGGSTASDAT